MFKIELGLNEIEVELIIESLKDKSNENAVTNLFCNGIIKHIQEKAQVAGLRVLK